MKPFNFFLKMFVLINFKNRNMTLNLKITVSKY